MRAVRYHGPGDVRVEEIPEPVAGDGQIKIKVFCGSDLHLYHALLPPITPTLITPNYVTGETLPVVMGHELSGTIVELGAGVDSDKYAVGQTVVVEPVLSCMEPSCGPCTAGTRNVCPHLTFIGIGGGGGGMAEYISVKQNLVYVLPAGIPLEVGALMEPLSIVWHAINRSNFKPGDNVLILGAGPIGLLLLKVLRARGAQWIGVSEPAARRRETAVEFSASIAFDPSSTDVVAETRRATQGQGADVVFDCAGIQASIDTAIVAARPRGNVTNVAIWEKSPVIDLTTMTHKEVTISSAVGCDRVHNDLIRAVADGKLTGLEALITRKIAFEDVVEKGILALIHEKDTQIKVLVHP
ncbi:alcohol dehydrogenase GroES domain protein [Sparassis latifolia]